MTELTKQQKIDLVKQMIEHKRRMDEFSDQFQKMFGTFPGNGECSYESFDLLFSDYMKLVADRIGDSNDGISWFVWENDCGKEGMDACADEGRLIPILDAEDYVDFVEACGK